MSKTNTLPFTQNLNTVSVGFNSSDIYSLIKVAVTSVGSNLTPGTRTFTAAGGTTVSGGGGASTFTMTAVGAGGAAYVSGSASITQPGAYTVGNGPTAAANAATVDSGSSNATFALTTGVLKTLYTASANDAVVKVINVSSTDSAARIMSLWVQDAALSPMRCIGAINIPATSGTGSGTTATIDLLGSVLMPSLPYDSNGKKVLPLKAGAILLASVPAITASTYIDVLTLVEEY